MLQAVVRNNDIDTLVEQFARCLAAVVGDDYRDSGLLCDQGQTMG